jgi:hypothetical protein
LFGGFRNAAIGSPEAAWNTAMSRVRECVEWGFKEIIAQFSFLDFKASMKIFQSPVAQYYVLGAFFQNIRSLKYSNQTASYFSATPMSLDTYLAHQKSPPLFLIICVLSIKGVKREAWLFVDKSRRFNTVPSIYEILSYFTTILL